jgi:hypothetical protein
MASWGDALDALSDNDASESGVEGAGGWSAALENLEEGSSSDLDHPPPLHAWQGALDAAEAEDGDSATSSSSPEVIVVDPGAAGGGADEDIVDPLAGPSVLQLSHQCRHIADASLDQQRMKAFSSLLAPDLTQGSITNHAKALDCSRKDLRRDLRLLAATAVQVERHTWRHFEQKLAAEAETNQELELLLYIDFVSYDSADFRIQMDTEIVADLQLATDVACAGAVGGAAGVDTATVPDPSVGVKKYCKLTQLH